MSLKIKICGMRQAENIEEALALDPDFMGFIFYDKSPRNFDQETILNIEFPETTKRIGVFVNENIETILSLAKKYQLDGVQLHGSESPEFVAKLKKELLLIIKAFGIDSKFNFEQLKPYEGKVDYFLFDTKINDSYGGTGEVFNWEILDQYKLTTPFFLAGGLGPEQLEQIKKINNRSLFAIDLNSKFELEPGLKDINELNNFIRKIRQ